MYLYRPIDREFRRTAQRVPPPGGPRRPAGEPTEDQFKPLRLMNGLYPQLHACMLRIAIPTAR